ncbi:MAG: molybdenum cofactor biosynthesis protein MoaE [Actinomycetota bacterium]
MKIITGLSAEPLDIPKLVSEIRDPQCGGLVVFEGSTRSPSEGKIVLSLEYEAYEERAIKQLEELAREAVSKFGLGGVVAMHRTGVVEAGDPSVIVAACAPHRAEAFEGARWLIDTLKEQVAIWKKEVFESPDGRGEAWV